MSEFVSQREFAKRVGRSHVWVNRLVKEGRLPSNSKGQIPLTSGLEAYQAAFTAGQDANRKRGEEERRKAAAKKAAPKTAKGNEVDSLPHVDIPPSGATVALINQQFNRARLAEKTFQAKLRELEYKEASGELIPRDDVQADAERTGAEVRERLMSVPPRVAGLCEGKTAREIERIIEEAINEALSALQRARFGR